MATIITVHGTNASGPEEGVNWWQKGSEFERDIRKLVESEDGQLSFQPHIWDGDNSEMSRRRAGEALYDRITQLETASDPYTMIGHSHGGSVIASSLMAGAKDKNALANLKSWLTIGTPFISLRKNLFLFSRLNSYGKAIYVSLVTLVFIHISAMTSFLLVYYEKIHSVSMFFNKELPGAIGAILISTVPFFIFYFLFLYIDRRKNYLYREKNRKFFIENFDSRYVALNHRDDEAVQGLTYLKGVDFEIFSKAFAVPTLSVLAVFFVPLMIVILSSSETATREVAEFVAFRDEARVSRNVNDLKQYGFKFDLEEKELVSSDSSIFQNILLMTKGANVLIKALEYFIRRQFGVFGSYMIIVIAFPIAAISIISIFGLVLIVYLSKGVSRFLSRRLNRLTWRQIRQTAYGNDTEGEFAEGARLSPAWMVDNSCKPIPDALGDEISAYSDKAAAKSISKFRAGIRQFAFTKGEADTSDMFSDYLTWDELIHTSYFDIPRFRKYVAYIITQADGFRATKAFQDDPDFAKAALWYEDMQMEHQAASSM